VIGKGEGSQAAGHGRVLTGDRHMVAAGHYAAAHAGFLVLEAGGNAIDAGVAAGMALGVLQSDIVNVAGVAPIMIRLAGSGEVVTIDGLGVWPAAASAAFFRREHGGRIPDGLLRTVTPAAPAAWIAALERCGTMSFGDLAGFAIRFAARGFPVHPTMAEFVAKNVAQYAQFPQNAALYLPGGRPVAVGDHFVQPELAATLQHMVDEEKAHAGRGRTAGLAAARAAFYEGDIAQTIAAYHREHGGWLTADDLGGYEVTFEPPVRTTYGGVEVFTCGPWCTGPLLGQILAILDGIDIGPMGHNSPGYIHVLTEAMKLAFADREACYGDPRFVDVPLERLLSAAFAAERRRRIDPNRAAPRRVCPRAAFRPSRQRHPSRCAGRSASRRSHRTHPTWPSSTGTATPSRRPRATPPTIRRSSPGPGSARPRAARNPSPRAGIRARSCRASARA